MNRKIIIGAVVLLVLILGGWYMWREYASQSEMDCCGQSTTEYETYSDSGVAFSYPSRFAIEETEVDFNDMDGLNLTLLPKDYVPPRAGEGPTAINVLIFDSVGEVDVADALRKVNGMTPEPSQGFDYQETMVGGKPALAYTATGLYESDNVAAVYDGKLYIFSVSWMTREDELLDDFAALLLTVDFN